jgi:hypothetical protein
VCRAVERRYAQDHQGRSEVVPWEIDEGLYGVVYTTTEGREEGDPIGTKAEAERRVSYFRLDQRIGTRRSLTCSRRVRRQ